MYMQLRVFSGTLETAGHNSCIDKCCCGIERKGGSMPGQWMLVVLEISGGHHPIEACSGSGGARVSGRGTIQ